MDKLKDEINTYTREPVKMLFGWPFKDSDYNEDFHSANIIEYQMLRLQSLMVPSG